MPNASVVTLRSGKELKGNEKAVVCDKELEEEVVVHEPTPNREPISPQQDK